jgi:hypothetical protein
MYVRPLHIQQIILLAVYLLFSIPFKTAWPPTVDAGNGETLWSADENPNIDRNWRD